MLIQGYNVNYDISLQIRIMIKHLLSPMLVSEKSGQICLVIITQCIRSVFSFVVTGAPPSFIVI